MANRPHRKPVRKARSNVCAPTNADRSIQRSPSLPGSCSAGVEIIRPLTSDERAELARCEERIRRSFIDICTALLTIHDKKLYREKARTFEQYTMEVFNWGRNYAYRHVEAGRIIQLLLPMGNIPLPRCERQVRPLTKAPPELVPEVWIKAVEVGGADAVTAKHVEQALQTITNVNRANGSGANGAHLDHVSVTYFEEQILKLLAQAKKHVKQHKLEEAFDCLQKILVRADFEKSTPSENPTA